MERLKSLVLDLVKFLVELLEAREADERLLLDITLASIRCQAKKSGKEGREGFGAVEVFIEYGVVIFATVSFEYPVNH